MTVHNPSGFVQFDDESRDDLFISNTSDTIRSCYMLNLGFSLVDDFAFNANANNKDNSRTEIDDEDNNNNDDYDETPLKVAIQTARIFNGIIVGNHGTLLKQNNRADPDKLGTTVKEGQSRQALQIEQIIAAATNKNDDYGYADDDTNNNLDDDHRNSNTTAAVNNDDKKVNDDHGNSTTSPQLLIVRGQYEDVSHLIRNGSEILRKKKDDNTNKKLSSLSLVPSISDQNDY